MTAQTAEALDIFLCYAIMVLYLYTHLFDKKGEDSMKNSRLTVLFAPLLALVLELLPWGTVVYFFDPALGRYRNVYSYFSLVPFGYANVGPFFTALATCVLLVLLILYVFKGKRSVLLAATGVSCVVFLVSLTAMPYGVTMVGVLVTVMLLVSSVLLILKAKKSN